MALNISPVHRNLHTSVSFLYLEFEDWFARNNDAQYKVSSTVRPVRFAKGSFRDEFQTLRPNLGFHRVV